MTVSRSAEAGKARQKAAAAIAIYWPAACAPQCLVLSLRWDIGQRGARGGLVAAERAALRRRTEADLARGAPRAPVILRPTAPLPESAEETSDDGTERVLAG